MKEKRFTAVILMLFVLDFALTMSSKVQAQNVAYPAMAPVEQYMMDRDAEIALARSAGPESISRDATILILGRQGYELAVQGKNGFVCLVDRAWKGPFENPEFWNPKHRSATCYNKEAGASLQSTYLRTKLVLQGLSKEQIRERLKTAVDTKEIPPVEPGAMCFMMGKGSYLSDNGLTADGAHNMAHLMFFTPQINPGDWAANLSKSPVVMDPAREGDPERIDVYMVLTGMWSDGTPAPLQ